MSCQTHRSAHEGGTVFPPKSLASHHPRGNGGSVPGDYVRRHFTSDLSLSNHLGFGFEYGRSLKPARTTRNTCCEFMLYKAIFG